MHGTILVYGNDEMLLSTRKIIFERAGYTVFTAASVPNAMLVLMNHEIDVLVLCQSVDDCERRSILETARTLQPKIKCVSLSLGGNDIAMDGVYNQHWSMNPPALLAAIGQMLLEKTS
jgi:DNA-binding NtrC family response regulator